MDFFEKAFQWLAEVSQKLPAVDTNLFFIVVLAVIFGLGIVIAFTLLGSRARKLFVSARKIRKYLANVDVVDDDNVSDFTAHCFPKNTPQPLRDAWVQYLGVRFGYPSDIVSDGAVYDKFVKKNKDVRSGVFVGVSLVLLALFAFWGYGVLPAEKMGVVHLAALALIGVMYLVLVILARKQNQRCFETFEAMQEDLDAKVNLQIESNFATDSSPLQELNSLVEEIIARNTAKVVDEDDEQTPIEALIEQKMQEQSELDDDEQENIDEIISAQEEAQEENAQDGDVESDDEQRHIDELLQEQEERLEETADEESEETETSIEEADEQVDEQEHIDELLQEQQEELEEKAQEETDETELEIESADETFVEDPQEGEEQSVEEQEPEAVDESENFDEAENEEGENAEIEENAQNDEYTESEENNVQEDESVEEDVQETAVEDESAEQDTEEEDSVEEAAEDNENTEQDAQTDGAEESAQDESETTQDVEREQDEQSESEENDESDENVVESENEEFADESAENNESDEEVENDAESGEETENEETAESEESETEEEYEDVEGESEEIEEAKEDEEPEVVYVVDDEDEEENARPAKLVKLPNLVDYMLSKNMPKQMKIQIATMLIGTYNKFKDSKEDRKIVISCLGKVMRDLQSEKQ